MADTNRDMDNVAEFQAQKKVSQAWRNMIARCTDPRANRFERYGGRGITVCERWRNSFEAFRSDVGLPPSRRHSLDRINNDGNYEPGNVRWATPEQQAANRNSRVVIQSARGPLTTRQAAAILNVSPTFVFDSRCRGLTTLEQMQERAAMSLRERTLKRETRRKSHSRRLISEMGLGL